MTTAARDTRRAAAFDARRVRGEFPLLARRVHGKPLVYLDSAATTQKPRAVIDAVSRFYETCNSNVHRGVHRLSQEATEAFEGARATVARFLHARSPHEVVFTRGTTEAINLVAASYGRPHVGPGDEVLISALEHHSDIVPWQMLCRERGARLLVIPVDEAGDLRLDEMARLLSDRTRLVAVNHVSNALGTVNPVAEIVGAAHARGVPVLVDGAQAVSHLPVDVQALDADFYALSSHKVYGPTGIGVLWAKEEILKAMPPWQGGGDMIRSVRFEETTYAEPPHRFEAGTPDIAGAVGFAAALDWLSALDREGLRRHEEGLLALATERVGALEGVRIVGTARRKAGVLSFVLDRAHPHDVGTVLDLEGIAVRTGHHCAQPVMERFGVPATVRASFAAYSLREDVEALVTGLHRVREVFA